MTDADDIVMLVRGEMPQVEVWNAALADEGITGRVVGEDLTAGLGTAFPGSVELWVHRADAERGANVLRTLAAGGAIIQGE